jgi:hypothetical protein
MFASIPAPMMASTGEHFTSYFPAQNSTPLVFGENRPVGGKLQDRTESNLTPAAAVDSFL